MEGHFFKEKKGKVSKKIGHNCEKQIPTMTCKNILSYNIVILNISNENNNLSLTLNTYAFVFTHICVSEACL